MKQTSTLAALVITLSLVSPARAQQAPAPEADGPTGVLRLSKLYSFGGGTDLQHGFGLDARYRVYPARAMAGHLGLFGQGQYELGDAWRVAGGLSAGWDMLELELGISHRTETDAMAGSTGLHVAQSFTFGPVSVGGRLTIPLVDHIAQGSTMGTQGIEGALVLRLGFDFTVHGQRRSSGCHGHAAGGVRDPHSPHGHGR